MRRLRVPQLVQFVFAISKRFWLQNQPQNCLTTFPKNEKHLTDFGTSFDLKKNFFWGPRRANISQDGLPKRSETANIAISTDFGDMHFVQFFNALEHQTPHQDPQDGPEASGDGSRQFPRASQTYKALGVLKSPWVPCEALSGSHD